MPCIIKGCTKVSRLKRKMCLFHYERWRNGIPLESPEPRKAGEGTIKYGYLLVPRNGRQVPFHRIVMAEKLGRPLSHLEVVHHIDGNKQNNSPENLELLNNQSEHMILHRSQMTDDERTELGKKFSEIQIARWKRWKADPILRERASQLARERRANQLKKKKHRET